MLVEGASGVFTIPHPNPQEVVLLDDHIVQHVVICNPGEYVWRNVNSRLQVEPIALTV